MSPLSKNERTKSAVSAVPTFIAVAPQGEGLLTRIDLANRLNVSVRTVEEWQEHGALPFIKIGNVVRFHWPDVINHLRAHFCICRTPDEETQSTSAASHVKGGVR